MNKKIANYTDEVQKGKITKAGDTRWIEAKILIVIIVIEIIFSAFIENIIQCVITIVR